MNPDDLERAADVTEPDIVVDCVAYTPREVRRATEVFADTYAYVVVSSGAAYGPKNPEERVLSVLDTL